MDVLIVGGGGREHALAWKAAQSSKVKQVYVAPGNAGTATEPKVTNLAIEATNIAALVAFAKENQIGLTIIGPEVPLVAGIVDAFEVEGLPCFGPSQKAAVLEGSKSFSKDFLARHQIPTAEYALFTDVDQAISYLRGKQAPIVVKADGLAAGKGVILAQTIEEAESAVKDMLAGNAFGEAGHRVVIEEFLQGEEASFIVMVDGEHILPMASSQDHKARDDGDRGPNTGGMGAYSPAPVVTAAMHDKIMQQVIEPTVKGMAREGRRYRGFLYAGVMIDQNSVPKVLEFNCRFGDPETQPIMMRMQSDLVELCLAAMAGRLDQAQCNWDPRPAVGVVLAAGGYPDTYESGCKIEGLPQQEGPGEKVFHAGTKFVNGEVVTATGVVVGLAPVPKTP